VEKNALRILRSGPITGEELRAFAEVREAEPGKQPEAPGQLASHYAPRTMLHLEERVHLESLLNSRAERKGFLVWQRPPAGIGCEPVEILSIAGDLREAAATLFAKLRRLDEAGLDVIFAEPVPERGLGIAIMDRLRKAAHPK
jgi:L-threonylcarbamoyladenylate synthase